MSLLRPLLILLALGVALPAGAEDKAGARAAFSEGTKYYDLAQFDKALEAFTRAYWNFEDPNILYNIAQCQRALGHKREAADQYRSYLRKATKPPNRPEVERMITDLNAQLDQESRDSAAANAPVDTTAPVGVVTATPPTEHKPVWKRAWVWGVVGGGVVAVGLGVGLGVGLTRSRVPHADGTVSF